MALPNPIFESALINKMDKLNREIGSEYIVCHHCGYDANEKDCIKCQYCGTPLSLNSGGIESEPEFEQQELNQQLKPQNNSVKKSNFLLPLLSLLILGGGLFLAINQVLVTNNKNQTVTNNRANSNARLQKITLLGDTFSGYSTFRAAKFQEKLKEVGLNLNYQDEFDQAKRANLLNQNQADLFVTTLDQFLQQKPKGKIVGMLDRTIGADAIVLNTPQYPELKSLIDLKRLVEKSNNQGNRFSLTYAGDTPSEYLALVLDTKFDSFDLLDFKIKEVPDASDAWQLLQNPQENVAVAVLWEPFVSEARKQGYTVVLSSQDASKSIIDVIVASDRLIQSQPDTITKFLTAYYRIIDGNVREPSYLKQQIAEDGNLSSSQAVSVLKGIDFFTSVESKNWMEDGILAQRIQSIAATLVLTGRMDEVPSTPQDLFTSKFLNEAARNTETLIGLIRADNPVLADRLAGKQTTIPTPTISPSSIKQAPDIGNLRVRGEVLFDLGSTNLSDQSQQTLDQLAQEIGEFNEQTVAVIVIGHTSKSAFEPANLKLSEARAQVVAQGLRARGLNHTIIPEGKGSSQLLSEISPNDPRQQRTEIRLVRIN